MRMNMTMWWQTLLLVAVSLETAIGSPLGPEKTSRVKETHPVPRGWRRTARANAAHNVNLQIGLKQGNFNELERSLYEGTCQSCCIWRSLPLKVLAVSTPSHPRYGQHLSSAEVHELVKPSDDALTAVQDWLATHGVSPDRVHYSKARDWIKLSLPIATIERMLDTEYHLYVHEDGDRLLRTPHWSLPQDLHKHISTIQPTNSFFRPQRRSKLPLTHETFPIENVIKQASAAANSSVAAVCNSTLFVTPDCLRTLYGTINYTVQAAGKNFMALNDFLGEINIRTDAEKYLEAYRPDAEAAAQQFSQISINGGTVMQNYSAIDLEDGTGIEGNLDAQTMMGIAWPGKYFASTFAVVGHTDESW